MAKQGHGMMHAPFDVDDVLWLSTFQALDGVHPFCCANEFCRAVLEATANGWLCPACGYRQDWAWELTVEHARKVTLGIDDSAFDES